MNKLFAPFLPPWAETGLQPAFYDLESGTVLQQTARMYDKVNQLIRLFNALSEETKTTVEEYIAKFVELKDFVDDYFENLDVQEEINNKLDEMAEDGTLEEIVSTYLQPYVADIEKNTEDIAKTGNLNTPEYIYSRIIKSMTDGSYDAHIPAEQEGIVITGENKIVTFYSPFTIDQNGDALVEEINFANPKNPQIIRSNTIQGLMHCNSACYNPTTGKIYVTLAKYDNNGAAVYVNKIGVVSYNTLTLDEVLTVSGVTSLGKIAYDQENDKYYIIADNAIWELNINTLGVTKLFDIDTTRILTTQGLNVRKGYIYIQMTYPRAIVKLDFEGNIVAIYNIDDYDNEGHSLTQVADFDFIDDDNIIITPHARGDYVDKSVWHSSYYVNYLCKMNLKGSNFARPSFDGLFSQRALFVNTALADNDILFENGSSSYPIALLGSYLINKYFVNNGFRTGAVNSNAFTYYGSLMLQNVNLYVTRDLIFESCALQNSSIDAPNITATSTTERVEIYGSRISCQTFKIYYNEDSPMNIISGSDINLTRLLDSNNAYSLKIKTRGSRFNKQYNSFKLAGAMPNQFLGATLSTDSNVVTADFSGYLDVSMSSEFFPNNYLLGIRLKNPDETMIYLRTQSFADNRIIYDHAGNTYAVTLYDMVNHTLTITSTNAANITAVTMVLL